MSYFNFLSLDIIGLGLAIGIVLGLTGAGGAILSVPLLILALNLNVQQAAPIGLMAVTLASSIAALLGLRDGIVRYKAAALMALLGLLLSPLGFWAAQRLPNPPLVIVFSAVLCVVAIRMWRSGAATNRLGLRWRCGGLSPFRFQSELFSEC